MRLRIRSNLTVSFVACAAIATLFAAGCSATPGDEAAEPTAATESAGSIAHALSGQLRTAVEAADALVASGAETSFTKAFVTHAVEKGVLRNHGSQAGIDWFFGTRYDLMSFRNDGGYPVGASAADFFALLEKSHAMKGGAADDAFRDALLTFNELKGAARTAVYGMDVSNAETLSFETLLAAAYTRNGGIDVTAIAEAQRGLPTVRVGTGQSWAQAGEAVRMSFGSRSADIDIRTYGAYIDVLRDSAFATKKGIGEVVESAGKGGVDIETYVTNAVTRTTRRFEYTAQAVRDPLDTFANQLVTRTQTFQTARVRVEAAQRTLAILKAKVPAETWADSKSLKSLIDTDWDAAYAEARLAMGP